MEAIIFLIGCVLLYKYVEAKKKDRMTSNQRFEYELNKITGKRR